MNKVRNVHYLKDKIVVFYLIFALMYPLDLSSFNKIKIHDLDHEQEQEIDNEKTKFCYFNR